MSKIPPELEAQMTPAVKAAYLELVEKHDALLARCEALEKMVKDLTGQIRKLTPRNSSRRR